MLWQYRLLPLLEKGKDGTWLGERFSEAPAVTSVCSLRDQRRVSEQQQTKGPASVACTAEMFDGCPAAGLRGL